MSAAFTRKARWHRLYVFALSVCVGGSTYGLTISRPILQHVAVQAPWAETLQFWYPITTTFFQFATTFVLLNLARGLAPILRRYMKYWPDEPSYIPLSEGPKSISHSPDERNIDIISRKKSILSVWALAAAIALEACLGAYAIYYAPIEVYLLSRGCILLVCHIIYRSTITKQAGSLGLVSIRCAYVLVLGVWLAAYRPGLPFPGSVIGASLASCILAAVCTFHVENVVEIISSTSKGGYAQLNTTDGHKGAPVTDRMSGAGLLWNLIYYTSLLSLLTLLPIFLFSGEIGHILRNCYFLDIPLFWAILIASGLFRCILFVSTILLVNATSAFDTTFFIVFINISQVALLSYWDLLPMQGFGLIICFAIVIWLYWDGLSRLVHDFIGSPQKSSCGKTLKTISRKALIIIGAVCICFMGAASVIRSQLGIQSTIALRQTPPGKAIGVIDPAKPLLKGTEAYLGHRPHDTASANLDILMQECRGTYEQMEHMRNISKCLNFLSTSERLYIDSKQDGKLLDSQQGSIHEKCSAAETTLYHIWWSGPPTWRIELFIKGYLFTQNLPCSELWIWVNCDNTPGALDLWLESPYFQKFQALVDKSIFLEEWKLPSRIPISADMNDQDRARYFKGYSHNDGTPKDDEEVLVADSLIRAKSGEWLQLYAREELQITHFPVAASDAARLTILHLHGGVYVDVDMILLRDMAPLVRSGLPFAERWGSHGESMYYNNAVVSLPKDSAMSSYLLRGGTRMGHVYHFIALARILTKEGLDDRTGRGLLRMETAFFDPIMGEIDGLAVGKCTVPCLTSFEDVFRVEPARREWEGFGGKQVPGVGNNRTLENFYRGAYAYHMHNKWTMRYEAGSWLDIICRAHDEFLNGERANAYGEKWKGKPVARYGE